MSENKLTIIAAGTYVRGNVFSQDALVVEGGIEGHLVGNKVTIKSSGWVQGDLTCRSMSIEMGGVVHGRVRVASETALPRPAVKSQAALNHGAAGALPHGKEPPPPEGEA